MAFFPKLKFPLPLKKYKKGISGIGKIKSLSKGFKGRTPRKSFFSIGKG
jgi:hypothetical protein